MPQELYNCRATAKLHTSFPRPRIDIKKNYVIDGVPTAANVARLSGPKAGNIQKARSQAVGQSIF